MQTIEMAGPQGRLLGIDHGGAYEFLGVPYASFGGRFRYALPVEPWEGVRDATHHGPAFVHRRHRISVAGEDGPVEIEQSEDAFVVSISTPTLSPDASLPVIVWLHGGGYSSGSGSYPCYSGVVFAESQNAVVVTANYRLGVFGNLDIPGIADENCSIHDTLDMLRWVHGNIDAFGGDPGNITLAGQSAGGWYVTALAGMEEAQGLFSKVMLMSTPTPWLIQPGDSSTVSKMLVEELGVENDPERLRDLPAHDLLDVGRKVEIALEKFGVAFTPYDTATFDTQAINVRAAELSGKLPLLDGVAANENALFMAKIKDQIDAAGWEGSKAFFDDFVHGDPDDVLAQYRARFPEASPFQIVVQIDSDAMFVNPGNELTASFENSYGYRIEYESGNPVMGACHCLDMPLLFGNLDVWKHDPMLEGNDMAQVAEIGRRFRDCVGAFMRTGCPETEETPWPRFEDASSRVGF